MNTELKNARVEIIFKVNPVTRARAKYLEYKTRSFSRDCLTMCKHQKNAEYGYDWARANNGVYYAYIGSIVGFMKVNNVEDRLPILNYNASNNELKFIGTYGELDLSDIKRTLCDVLSIDEYEDYDEHVLKNIVSLNVLK